MARLIKKHSKAKGLQPYCCLSEKKVDLDPDFLQSRLPWM